MRSKVFKRFARRVTPSKMKKKWSFSIENFFKIFNTVGSFKNSGSEIIFNSGIKRPKPAISKNIPKIKKTERTSSFFEKLLPIIKYIFFRLSNAVNFYTNIYQSFKPVPITL